MTPKTIVIGKGDLRAEIVPSLGGGLARFDFGGEPVFRPWPQAGSNDPFDLACNLLMPWSNRISGGGFHVDGVFHALEPNLPGERYPIHGNAFQREWSVGATTSDSVTLSLESDGPGPYRYAAEVHYTITDRSLTIAIAPRQQGADPCCPTGSACIHGCRGRRAPCSMLQLGMYAWKRTITFRTVSSH